MEEQGCLAFKPASEVLTEPKWYPSKMDSQQDRTTDNVGVTCVTSGTGVTFWWHSMCATHPWKMMIPPFSSGYLNKFNLLVLLVLTSKGSGQSTMAHICKIVLSIFYLYLFNSLAIVLSCLFLCKYIESIDKNRVEFLVGVHILGQSSTFGFWWTFGMISGNTRYK